MKKIEEEYKINGEIIKKNIQNIQPAKQLNNIDWLDSVECIMTGIIRDSKSYFFQSFVKDLFTGRLNELFPQDHLKNSQHRVSDLKTKIDKIEVGIFAQIIEKILDLFDIIALYLGYETLRYKMKDYLLTEKFVDDCLSSTNQNTQIIR
ncbi:hypothetical protein [Lyticum sinuosum]|uniref:Uncharacterized protein n=1 Tax=Lyticum sinuosum TaxID=1332059 RepID=A0AAE5AHG7_9RICK|nr:hypothetical protein [Lyticum sinuosum]MDZ5761550.1 hypothetical protein [Lyticum sinuosum]